MSPKDRKRWPRIPLKEFPFDASIYPGRRPLFSFLFTPQCIYRFTLRTLGQLLDSCGLPPVDERYAVLAYGSNACPGQLMRKYQNHRLTNVPVLYGRLTGAEAVYAKRRTNGGYVPATLAKKDGSGPSWITLLTAEQLRAMDASEGRPGYYVLARVPEQQFTAGRSRLHVAPLYTYVNICGGVMTLNGHPVSLGSTTQKRCLLIYDQTASKPAEDCLNFVEIPNPHPPEQYSQIHER